MYNVIISACLYVIATQGALVTQDKLSPQDAFFLKRMTEFWKDRDFGLVKTQVEEFLKTHPDSQIKDNLQAILADILYQEHSYQAALDLYDKIMEPSLRHKTLSRRCQCLYLLGHYDAVISTLTPLLGNAENKIDFREEMQFLLADSLFRKLRTLDNAKEQNALALQAKPLLLALYETNYRDKVLMQLAEIHRMLGENPQASAFYTALADKFPDKKEEILLQVATLQLDFNKNAAIETFQQVVNLGQGKAADAAYNEFLLLFQENRFAELVSRAPLLSPHLSQENKTLFNFCLGRSHFKLDQLSEAISYFTQFVEAEKESTPYKRAAFLTLITCAQKTANPILFDTVLEQFLASFPNDDEAAKALLLHAQVAMQSGNVDQATTDLKRLLSAFPEISEKETLLYDLALLLSKSERWNESRQAFITYLDQYPQTSHLLIWSSIVHCSVQELKEATAENLLEKKAQLATDLQQALNKPNLFTSDEQASYNFLLGQLLFDLRSYQQALSQLTTFTEQYSNHPSMPQAILLQAHLHRELKSPPDVFANVAEKALALTTDGENRTALRLQLFNTYLALKEYDKAAEHLYQSHMVDEAQVQTENQLWLAHYYYGKAKEGNKESSNRASLLFQKILKTDDAFGLHFDPQQTYLESEVLKYGELLTIADKKQLLTSLLDLQAKNSSQTWKLQRQTLFEMGKIYLSENNQEAALKMFEDLISTGTLTPSYYSNAALLEKSRILLARCEEKSETNPAVASILSTLKDLQIQKKLSCEPLHLEAALEYADVRASLSPAESRRESAIFFLNRVRDDFAAKDDSIGQEYHEARVRFPEKDQLYQSYMKCIEAEILRLEAQLAKEQNNLEKAAQSEQVALALLEEVLHDEQITPYLRNRAELNLKHLRQ
jgi:tetratricopeptide (TPR) repeat protein